MIKGTAPEHVHTLDAFKARRIDRAPLVRQGGEAAQALGELQAVAMDARARRVHGWMTDAEVSDLAKRRADLMRDTVHTLPTASRESWVKGLAERLADLDAKPPRITCGGVAGVVARLCCPIWWARQLKRAAVREREAFARQAHEVCAKRLQPYVTDDTVKRLQGRDKRNADILAGTELESQDGTVITLADAVKASTANPAIRRGELMTRITGCEAWADANGWRGMFTTHTAPSRFHATHHTGAKNDRWTAEGRADVKAGQAWLCATWARARAEFKRKGLDVFGFRVAEPHQDGTPHWHMMLWARPGQRAEVCAILRAHWLADAGEEKGAKRHRFKAKSLRAGGAAGYVAKYIAKGIDDEGDPSQSGHLDDAPDGSKVHMSQDTMHGGGAYRVRAWARAHGIRQFQAFGQPPVTVWRELRRVPVDAMHGASDTLLRAWDAVNKDGEKKASWGEYMTRQGGAGVGLGYRVAIVKEQRQHVGRYEVTDKACPVGVADRLDTSGHVAVSNRQTWKPRGTWAAGDRGGVPLLAAWRAARAEPAQPWTRDINCTGAIASQAPKGHTLKKTPGVYVYDWRDFFAPEVVKEIESGRVGGSQPVREENGQSFCRVAVGESDRREPPPLQ